jgi:RNA polymerase sigma-70 factor, ECF subfamily
MISRESGDGPDDSELFERWRRGDEAAGQEIVRRYDRRLYGYFLANGWSPQESEDLKQETWRRVIRNMAIYRGEVPFDVWIFILAKSVFMDALRRKKRLSPEVPLDEDLQVPTAEPTAEESVQRKQENVQKEHQKEQRNRLLRQAIEELAPQRRRCLILKVYNELSTREIAQRMNLSEGAVRAHLFQARKKLREILKDLFLENGIP